MLQLAGPDKSGQSVPGIEEWEAADSTSFMVRGPSYLKSRVKQPSASAIYRSAFKLAGSWVAAGLTHSNWLCWGAEDTSGS